MMLIMYVSVGLTAQARDVLRGTTLDLTTPAARRLTMSEVLLAALLVASRHRDELLAELTSDPGSAAT
jgi:hypothetical protein